MLRFDSYFLMKENDVVDFVKQKLDLFTNDAILEIKEIGDGNLNYVFRVFEPKTKKSVIIKQAGEALRISAEMFISTDRNRIESEILQIQYEYAPNLVPKIFMYDTIMCACAMEDLSDYTLMRYALMEHKTFPNFADDITTYMVNTLFLTTDIVKDHKEKKGLVKSFINPELCEITEDLVFTEPYNDINNRNNVFEKNKDFVKKELYNDIDLHLEVAKLKFNFMNNAQALIHGDLHTGSIFVKETDTKVFDPEFAFYGPMGYDIGNILANLIFAWVNGYAYDKKDFMDWIIKTIKNIIDLFKEKFFVAFRSFATDYMSKTQGFAEWYLKSILSDSAGMAGTELIRRIVGMANVKDITMIKDEQKRALGEKFCISLAKKYIFDRDKLQSGKDFIDSFELVYNQFFK